MAKSLQRIIYADGLTIRAEAVSANTTGFILFLYILKKDVQIACFKKEFPCFFSKNLFHKTYKIMLASPAFRQRYCIDGNWAGRIYMISGSGIDCECERNIALLNRNSNISSNDLIQLKTFGLDRFSRMSVSALERYIPKERAYKLASLFPKLLDYKAALRWYARGLSFPNTIRKTAFDRSCRENHESEMGNNGNKR